MKIGYACLTDPATLSDVTRQLQAADCALIFTELSHRRHHFAVELNFILDMMTAGDTLVVVSFHHFSRSFTHLLKTFYRLATARIGVQSLVQSFVLTGEQMHLLLPTLTALLDFQAQLLRERTHAGLAAAKSRGSTGGRPRTLSLEQTQELGHLHQSGQLTVSQLAGRFGISISTVHVYLKRFASESDSS